MSKNSLEMVEVSSWENNFSTKWANNNKGYTVNPPQITEFCFKNVFKTQEHLFFLIKMIYKHRVTTVLYGY